MSYAKAQDTKDIIKIALKEDIGRCDITTEFLIPKNKFAKAALIAQEDFIVCGINIAGLVFKIKDKAVNFKPCVKDGSRIKKGKVMAWISGRAQSILTAERVALNFLSLLSGVTTQTRKYVDAVRPYKVKIMDTRKTIPGLRELEKYAVRIGGGYNHRLSLDELVLVKDNHYKLTESYLNLPKFTQNYQVELEVKSLKEFQEAIKTKPDIIMLDNMKRNEIRKAVRMRNVQCVKSHILLEASGGINLKNVKAFASTGIELISIGALTHSVDSVDISLEIL